MEVGAATVIYSIHASGNVLTQPCIAPVNATLQHGAELKWLCHGVHILDLQCDDFW